MNWCKNSSLFLSYICNNQTKKKQKKNNNLLVYDYRLKGYFVAER